jgi:hypothetical protein
MASANYKTPLVSAAIRSLWRSFKRDLFDTYRPELHYMRGPGPRWRAKHASRLQPPAMTGFVDASI